MILGIGRKLRGLYVRIYEGQKTIRTIMIVVGVLVSLYHLINSFLNYDLRHFIIEELKVAGVFAAVILVARIYHGLFGKWYVHEIRSELTADFVRVKFPRSVKYSGFRGAGKDSTANAIIRILREDLVRHNIEEMDEIRIICFPYDFDALDDELQENHEALMTNSKTEFFGKFIEIMKANDCFLKPTYRKEIDPEAHLQELYTMRKQPAKDVVEKIAMKYDDGIQKQHFIALLIKYSLLYVRVNYLPEYVITNQPYIEDRETGMMAKVFSTNYTAIQQDTAKWAWPIVGGVIIDETEADAFYPNIGKKGSAIKSGTRNFKAFFRHLLGESSVWFQVGQKSERTEKSIRELDTAFVTVLEQTKILGGEKRIFFVNLWLRWVEYWVEKSIRKKSKERQIRRRAKAIMAIRRLQNRGGYIYVDMIVSRSEQASSVNELSLREALAYDKPIRINYLIKLCFPITQCYGGYNTHYLEALAEILARKSKERWQDIPSWDPDMTLKMKNIEHMNYPVLNEIAGIKPKKIVNMDQPAPPKKAPKTAADASKPEPSAEPEKPTETIMAAIAGAIDAVMKAAPAEEPAATPENPMAASMDVPDDELEDDVEEDDDDIQEEE
ncbi:MAG: hypothetical protein WC509_02115 [Candidatus Izemoplasmatales bacterium]